MRFAGVAAGVLVIALRFAVGSEVAIPLVTVAQGVSAYNAAGARVFLVREGTLTLRAYLVRSPHKGEPLVFCPKEKIFVSPAHGEMFDFEGRWVAGPSPRDLDRVRVREKGAESVYIDPGKVARVKKSEGSVPGEVGEIYRAWRSDPSKDIGFCQNPVR